MCSLLSSLSVFFCRAFGVLRQRGSRGLPSSLRTTGQLHERRWEEFPSFCNLMALRQCHAAAVLVIVLCGVLRVEADATPSCAAVVQGPLSEVVQSMPPAALESVCLNASSAGICCNYFGWCGTSCHVPVAQWPGGSGSATLPAGASQIVGSCGDGMCTASENCTARCVG